MLQPVRTSTIYTTTAREAGPLPFMHRAWPLRLVLDVVGGGGTEAEAVRGPWRVARGHIAHALHPGKVVLYTHWVRTHTRTPPTQQDTTRHANGVKARVRQDYGINYYIVAM